MLTATYTHTHTDKQTFGVKSSMRTGLEADVAFKQTGLRPVPYWKTARFYMSLNQTYLRTCVFVRCRNRVCLWRSCPFLNDGITDCTAAAFSFTLSLSVRASCANLTLSILQQTDRWSVGHVHTCIATDHVSMSVACVLSPPSIHSVVTVSANMRLLQMLLSCHRLHWPEVCFEEGFGHTCFEIARFLIRCLQLWNLWGKVCCKSFHWILMNAVISGEWCIYW